MRADCLLDTNVLLYAISDAPGEAPKRDAARKLMAQDNWGLSVPVLQEFYVNATRAKKPIAQAAMTLAQAGNAVQQFMAYPLVPNTSALLLQAIELQKIHQTSFWDAMVIAAAHELGARTVYSEDLNHGQRYGNITVVNPFHLDY